MLISSSWTGASSTGKARATEVKRVKRIAETFILIDGVLVNCTLELKSSSEEMVLNCCDDAVFLRRLKHSYTFLFSDQGRIVRIEFHSCSYPVGPSDRPSIFIL